MPTFLYIYIFIFLNLDCSQNSNMPLSPNKQEYELWSAIQDIIGSAKLWPSKIRILFWTRNLDNFQRLIFIIFCYVNGLNPEIALTWARIKGLCKDAEAYRHLVYLTEQLEQDPMKFSRYYQYNVSTSRFELVDGSEKTF